MTETSMATVDELLGMAHDAYAQARESLDPVAKCKLMRLADDYLKQANEMRRARVFQTDWSRLS